MATVLQCREMDEKKSSREREPCQLRLPPPRPGSRTASATSTVPPVQAWRLSLLLWAGKGDRLQLLTRNRGTGKVSFVCSLVHWRNGARYWGFSFPHPSKMGPTHTDPQDVVLHFLPPHGLLTSTPGLAWDVQCNLKTLLYLDLISNMTALPTPTLCSQGNSSRLQEKKKEREEGPIPQPSKPLS